MSTWFKEEINHFGDTVDKSIQKASSEIQSHIDLISKELNTQRTLTRTDIEALIDYTALKFGSAIDVRLNRAKIEIATLVTDKVTEVRTQLADAAEEQKRTALRNASIAVFAAIFIGVVSLAYKHLFHGEVDLLTVFRVVLLAAGCGQIIWVTLKYVISYQHLNKIKKNVILVGANYFGLLRPKGAVGHIVLFFFIFILWLLLNYWTQLSQLLTGSR